VQFWKATPREISVKAKGYFQKKQETWEENAYLACWIVNNSGWRKKALKPHQLFKSIKTPKKTSEKRKAEAEETFRLHKKKSWMLIRGTKDKVKKFGDDPEHEKLILGNKNKDTIPNHPDLAKIKNFIKPK